MSSNQLQRLVRSTVLVSLLVSASGVWCADAGKAAEYYENGLSRFEAGDRAGAIIQLQNALQENGNLLSAHVLLAKALLEDLQLSAAEAALDKAMTLGVSPSEVAVPRARLLSALGRHAELLDKVTAEGVSGADRTEVLTLRAKAHATLGDEDAAMRGFEVAIATNRGDEKPYVELIPYLMQLGRLDEAQTALDTLEVIQPDAASTWNLKASMFHVRGRLDDALEAYSKALEAEPRHVDARIARASIYLDAKNLDATRQDLNFLRELVPEEPRANYLGAVLAGLEDDSSEVRQRLTAVAERIDALPGEYVSASEQLLMLGALAHHGLNVSVKAKSYLDRLLARYPSNLAARKLLAGIYLDERDSVRAMRTIEPVLRAKPNDPQALLLMGRAHLIDKRFTQANRYLEQAADSVKDDPRSLAALGFGLIGAGSQADGLARLEEAFRLDPANGAVGMVLATAHMRQGEHDRAIAVAQSLVDSNPDDLIALNLLGAIHAAKGDIAAAQSAYERALAVDAGFVPAQLNLARLEMARQRFESARVRLEDMSKTYPNDGRIYYEMGRLAGMQGDMAGAINALRTAVAKDRRDPQASLALVDALWAERRFSEALSVAKEAALRHRDDMAVIATLARAHQLAGDTAAARSVLREMTRLAEFDPAAQVRIGRMYMDVGAPDDAEYNVRKARTASPDFEPALALAVEIAIAKDDAGEARKRLAQLQAVAPKHPDIPGYEARVAWLGGEREVALKLFRRAYEVSPSPSSAMALARANFEAANVAAAIAVLKRDIKRQPSASVRRALIELLMRERQWAEARDQLTALIEGGVRDANVLNLLATVYFELGDGQAMATAEEARRLAPNDPLVADTLGWIKLHAGDVSGALNLLRDARLRDPSNREIRFHLAKALQAAGRIDDARKELEFALKGEQAFPGRSQALELKQALTQ